MTGFFDPDYARDKAISELKRRVSVLEQRLADIECGVTAKAGTSGTVDPLREDHNPSPLPPPLESGGAS